MAQGVLTRRVPFDIEVPMRSIGSLFLMLSLLSVPAVFGCGGDDEEPSEPATTTFGSAPVSTGAAPSGGSGSARPAVEVRTPEPREVVVRVPSVEVEAPSPPSVTVTIPRPPSVTITPPSPGSVEVR